MTLTTPPGWYADPGLPGNERWWDGAAWTAHTRAAGQQGYGPPAAVVAPPPARRRGRAAVIASAAVLLVAGIAAAVLVARPGDDGARAAAPSKGPKAPSAANAPAPQDSPAPSRDPHRLVDQLNGITLPIPDGWEEGDDPVTGRVTMVTKDILYCPGDQGYCRGGGVSTTTATRTDLTTPEAVAKNDIADAAKDAYDADPTGNGVHHYNGITSHQEVKSAPVSVGGSTGYLVRWRVKTGAGSGGYVESLAFPAPMANQAMVIVRLSFDAGSDGPPLALMDTITQGIAPIGGGGGGAGNSGGGHGGVGTSLAPPSP
ncbi:DUF2510 domain-containing protein [Streptomyces sp. Edi4]|uniref:DUF2510 domain-containing protein n=1 Tax=Streptomyces sp. Edi4 TaxID=3162527 RepID=UPI0033061D4A